MLPANSQMSALRSPTTNPDEITGTGSSSGRVGSLYGRAVNYLKRYFSYLDSTSIPDTTCLSKRTCCSSVSDQADDYSPPIRHQLGGKGLFLQRMKEAGLRVPAFRCVTTQLVHALEQHPLDPHSLTRYLPDIAYEPGVHSSLTLIREYLNTLPPSEPVKRAGVLTGLAEFIASDDFYQQVKESEAAQQITDLRRQLDNFSLSQPIIVRSSGINEDNYGDAQAGKYLSLVQEEDDVLRTCLKVMASGYRPEVCPEGIPQPMALIIQECIDCQYGGVVMSFQSFQDGTIRVEFTQGQPRGVVAGHSGNTPHRIDISDEEGPDSYQYFPGTISSHFVLNKNNHGYSETRIDNVGAQPDDGEQLLGDQTVSDLREMATTLENLLFCPVDAEFAINRKWQLFPVQVRPVTRLSGGMDFALSIPEETIATGTGVSEGFCTGTLWLARRQKADSMPEGAIVVAPHAEDWMLEPGFLKRVGGFVIANGGFNDHVAILMKQEQKTLMLAGGQLAAVEAQVGQQATLACARFNDKPGAFIVAGDLTGTLASHRSLSSAVSDVPLAKAVPSRNDLSFPEGTFLQVASGFKWLTDQNARLLAFFAPGGGLDGLANPLKLSMSPQRSRILAETKVSVNRLVYGAEALLQGYWAFLQLAGEKGSPEVQLLRDELQQLISRFETLQKTIQSGLESVILPMQAAEEGRPFPGIFRQWLADCHKLQSDLQSLNPWKAEQVLSVHELIFALHQRFVEALAPVTLASGQGRISTEKKITYVDCTTPGGSDGKVPLLRQSGKALLEQSRHPVTVVSLDDALLVNLELGHHLGLIEALECAEGGKERTLRLRFSDRFRSPDGYQQPGKLKRMWFLARLLKAIELDKEADGMKISVNPAVGEMIVECSRMSSRKILQQAFEKLIMALYSTYSLDLYIRNIALFEGDQWCFNLLAQRLDSDVVTEADRFAFQKCLIQHGLCTLYYSAAIGISDACYSFLSDHQQQFINHSRRFFRSEKNFSEVLMSDEVGEDTRREVLHHFLWLNPDEATPLFELVYPRLRGQYYIIKPSWDYTLMFDVPPGQALPDHKEKVRNVVVKEGLTYASQQVRNDKSLVLATLARHPDNLKYASEKLKNDKVVVMAAVTQNGFSLKYASPKLQDNYEIVMAAVTIHGSYLEFASPRLRDNYEIVMVAIKRDGIHLKYASPRLRDNEEIVRAAVAAYSGPVSYASERIRSDKNIIKKLIAVNIDILRNVRKTLLNDRESMLDLIEQDSFAFLYASDELKQYKAFIEAAKKRNPEVIRHLK
ncbi:MULTISPECIES: DUF4116 domain-containing protein [unclassified Endozoicomonas]|uniref:DUF4116 domain-containing protein n=3 Tax=Endozoicomonas TaxID=305899 RepID=UPI003BB6780C